MAILRFPLPALRRRLILLSLTAVLISASVLTLHAASIHGVVTDATGARVTGASVSLISKGQVVASAASVADGSFTLTTGAAGRFFLLVSSPNFRQLQTPDFYAGQFDSIEQNLVLEPAWVRESITVTATGTPVSQQQTSSDITVLSPLDFALRTDFIDALRIMPGTQTSQAGQMGSQTSLFVRGGDSDDNKVLMDGVDVGDLGNLFDFGPLTTSGQESVEVYRGPDSNLFGAGAMTSVVSLTTPHGTTSFPSLLFEGDAGTFNTSREQLEVAGARGHLDYLGSFNWLQTGNALPNDEYHVATSTANLGWQPTGSTQIRGTIHYLVDGTGDPNAWEFYGVADDATQKDQNIYVSASIDNQTSEALHNNIRYGLTRKREQYNLWTMSGNQVPISDYGTDYCFGPETLGNVVTITGANGYSATGQAVLDCSTYSSQLVNNRDQLVYRGDITITPHVAALIGFQYEDERGAFPGSTFYTQKERTNYDYQAAVHGDFKNRFYYTLAGSLERYSLFGTQTLPRAGVSYYALKPRTGVFSGTRILFNFGDSDREPTLEDEEESLYTFLVANNAQSTIQLLHLNPISAPAVRTYEGGVEQAFLSEHILLRANYFHSQFGHEIEYVGIGLIPYLFPNLTATEQGNIESLLVNNGAYELTLNTEAFRAQGFETNVEGGIGKNIFLRGGYTYLDAVVQRSFSSDNEGLIGVPPTTFDNVPLGAYSPLVGARPFRRAPHTGFISATYSDRKITGVLTSAFASRSDDSTFLEGEDAYGGNSLLLPNRNLDHGYARIDLGGSYQLFKMVGIYVQGENLLSQQHIAPIGYQSLPMTVRAGLRIQWGIGAKQ
jgi:iron complex outermembrane receptor protein/vitamin B12 transporter